MTLLETNGYLCLGKDNYSSKGKQVQPDLLSF